MSFLMPDLIQIFFSPFLFACTYFINKILVNILVNYVCDIQCLSNKVFLKWKSTLSPIMKKKSAGKSVKHLINLFIKQSKQSKKFCTS